MEQISVIKPLMELYIIQDDEFHYGSVMLELGVALHGLGDRDLEEEKIGDVSLKLMRQYRSAVL